MGFGSDELENSLSRDENSYGGACSVRKMFHTKCRPVEIEPGKIVQKCERIEKIFRECDGRPSETIENRVEYTEDDRNMISDFADFKGFGVPSLKPYIPPILHDEFKNAQSEVMGGISSFLQHAQQMLNSAFENFAIEHGRETESTMDDLPFGERRYVERRSRHTEPKKEPFADYEGDFKDI